MMHKMTFALATVAGLSVASAGPLLASFSYEDLDSSFDSGSGQLVTQTMSTSTGSVSRLAAPVATADFDAGSASFVLDLSVSNILGNNADGSGTVTATDLNGDTMTADVNGTFTFVSVIGPVGIIFFDGVLTNLFFNDISGDGEFNGNSSFFSTDFTGVAQQPFFGGLQRLQITDVDFFNSSWSDELAEVDGQVVPTPGTLALVGLSAFAAGRRRR